MIKPVIHDTFFLSLPSRPAVPEDLDTVQNLLDTLDANRDSCVGMAANMIGASVQILVFQQEDSSYGVMLNPKILKTWEPYEAEEGCLSLSGTKSAHRFQKIRVQYQTVDFQTRIRTYSGWTAQIIQHEMDHFQGILI